MQKTEILELKTEIIKPKPVKCKTKFVRQRKSYCETQLENIKDKIETYTILNTRTASEKY